MQDDRSIPRLNRRQVLGAVALGATAPAWLAALPGWQSARATAPGEVSVGMNLAPQDFNPLTAVSLSQRWVFFALMSSLVTPNPATQTIEGDLAESWDVSDDGASYTFHLREGVTWHDGAPFTANDVLYTYTMALHPESGTSLAGRLALIKGGAAFSAGEAETLEGIEVVDDQTITFAMEFPNGLFLNECVLPIMPAHILEEIPPAEIAIQPQVTTAPIGTGPFKLVEYAADQYVDVEANPDYYMGPPNINRIVFNIITSPDTLQIAMGREEVDLPSFDGGTATSALFEEFIADERFRIDATAGSAVVGYGWNFRHDYLTDPRIHQAFLHAVDRPALISAFNSSNGTVYNSFMTHAWYQKPEWADLYPYDPDRARELLAEAGWDSSRTVDVNVITLANDDIRAMVAAEQQMLADVGFNIQFQEMEVGTWVERFYETHEFELVRVTFGVFPDPDGFLNFHMKSSSQNAFGYASPELDARIDEGRQLLTQEERAPIYQALNEEMLETLPVCPLYMQNTWWVRNKKWGVPLLDALELATDIESIPIHPIMLGGDDVWRYNPETWTKE